MGTEMWEWITKTLNEISKSGDAILIHRYADVDDIRSEVCMKLLEDTKTAEKIYKEKNVPYLRKLVNRTIYEIRSGIYFDNKEYFSRFQRIRKICEKYSISMIEENAYKISFAMQYENYSREEFGIKHIVKLLKEMHPENLLLNKEVGDNSEGNLSTL